MCDPVSIVALGGMVGGKAISYVGQKKAGQATQEAYEAEQRNQQRLQKNSLKTAVHAAEKNAPGTAIDAEVAKQTAATPSSVADAQSLAAAVGSTGTDAGTFTNEVAQGAQGAARDVDSNARRAAVLRAFGLVGQADALEKQNAAFRIGANRLEGEEAMALLPQRLQAAANQGRGWRLAGSVFDKLGSGVLSSGLGGIGGMVPGLKPSAGTAGTMGGAPGVRT